MSVVICRCQALSHDRYRWNVRLEPTLRPDLTLVVRMDATNQQAMDYYILPSLDFEAPRLRLFESNPLTLDNYRFETLDAFWLMGRRTSLKEFIR